MADTCETCGSALHGTELHEWLEGTNNEADVGLVYGEARDHEYEAGVARWDAAKRNGEDLARAVGPGELR